MPLDGEISLRIPSENLSLIEKVLTYRYGQGLLKKPNISEYIRYLINHDLTEVAQEIQKRRG